jgi:carbon-monoxide dehydrogenase iron sulfur subunit
LACSITNFGVANPRKGGIVVRQNLFERYEFQLICRQCEDPPCVDACMTGTLVKDPETGVVKMEQERCVGCWTCVMVCPYDAIFRDEERKVAIKCDLCPDKEIPACVDACPTEALVFTT